VGLQLALCIHLHAVKSIVTKHICISPLPTKMDRPMYLLFLNVLTVAFVCHCLSVWSMDYSNTIPFMDTSFEACQTKCAARPWCTGIGYARSLQLCYLLYSEEDFDEHGGLHFNGHIAFVQKANFKNETFQVNICLFMLNTYLC